MTDRWSGKCERDEKGEQEGDRNMRRGETTK